MGKIASQAAVMSASRFCIFASTAAFLPHTWCWNWLRTWKNLREIIHKRIDIGEHFTRKIFPEYRICFIH
jgi:hypothetical protein